MEISTETKIAYRKAIRETFKKMFGTKPSLEMENAYVQAMIEAQAEIDSEPTDCSVIH